MSGIINKVKKSWFRVTDGSLTNSKTLSVLWILPVIHLLVSMIIQRHFGYFYLWVTDPEYFHLMSGIALGHLHTDAAYIDHPGTPVQLVVALSSWINYLISGDKNLYTDVAKNPEQYIFAANLLFNILLMFVIYWLGKKTARITGNINTAILLQLGFFTSISIIRVTGRLLPEGFMLLPLSVLFVLILEYLFEDISEKKQRKQLIAFSAVIGWGLATKLSFLPFIIMPLIILTGTKNRLYLMLFSIIFFLLFAFPVLSHMNYFFRWTTNMFSHTGNWGNGPEGFMDFSQFTSRLRYLFLYKPSLFILMALLFVESLWILLIGNRNSFYKRYLKVSFGAVLSVLFLVFLICKQFAPHYLIPAILFNAFIILLILIPFVKKYHLNSLYFAGVLAALVFAVNAFVMFSNEPFPSINKQEKKICTFREKVNKNALLIISGHWSGTPFKEFSLSNGLLLTGPAMKAFKKPFKTVYPHSYFFYDWTTEFFHWGDYVKSQSLLQQNQPIYIYTGKQKEDDLQKILNRFTNENPGYNFKAEPVIDSKEYPEKLYLLTYQKKE